MSTRDDRYHAYHECLKCKLMYTKINTTRGEWHLCENKGCGGMNSPNNEVWYVIQIYVTM